ITSDEVVIEGLQVPDYVISINPKLNFLRSLYQEEIIGLTIYGSNGRLYKTDSLSTGSIIPYDTLTQNSDFSEFIASDATNGLILLPQGQAIYAFSLIFRISDDTSDLGYLLININPDYLLDEYFALSDNADLILNHNLIMVDSQVYYPSISKIDTDLALESQASGFSDGYRNYVIKENLYIEDVELITSVNSSGLRTDIGKLAWQIALIIISFTVASFFLSTLISKSVSSRLKHLAKRMESATDTMQKQSPVD
ncbi:MAG: hypothetical protein JXB20_05570, partial [Bacilli bacterium]|nr:hypothetical protein [Bacilli bacterium]